MKRALLLAAVLVISGIVVFAALRGAKADRCAEELVESVVAKDRGKLDRLIASPTLADELLALHQVELGFVRPLSTEHVRVGVFARKTATATRAEAIILLLETRQESCKFLRDYEPGPFEK